MNRRLTKNVLLLCAGILIVMSGCKKKKEVAPVPVSSIVNTEKPTNIGFTSAVLVGIVNKVGTGGITDYGFVWGETKNPDLNTANKKSLGAKTEIGTFKHLVSGLTAGKTYHVRAYLTDAKGTIFGKDLTFNALSVMVTSFVPTEGGQGDTLTITGSNFTNVVADITVKIGGIASTSIVSASSTEIKAVIPAGITEGAHKVAVTIQTIEGIATTDFTYLGGLWTRKKDFGGSNRIQATYFTVGQKAYICMGRTDLQFNKGLNDLWEYDAVADTWTQKANYTGGKRTTPVSFVIQDIAFVGLGVDETGIRKVDFWQYNPSSNTWAQISDFIGRSGYADHVAFSIEGKGYVAKLSTKELWEINLGTWTKKNNLSFSPSSLYSIINDVFYVLSNDLKFWEYNAISDSWTVTSKSIPGVFLGQTTLNGKGYAMTGLNNGYVIKEYNVNTNSITSTKASLLRVSSATSLVIYESFILGNKIFAREKNTNTFWEFDPSK